MSNKLTTDDELCLPPAHMMAERIRHGELTAVEALGSPHLDRTAHEDGTVAARLRAAGAIIVGHTNVPPMLGDFQSANPIFGQTNNP